MPYQTVVKHKNNIYFPAPKDTAYVVWNINEKDFVVSSKCVDAEIFLKQVTQKYALHYDNFKGLAKIIYPLHAKLRSRSKVKTYNKYVLEFLNETEKFTDKRVKSFLPSGQCYFNEKLTFNTDDYSHFKRQGKVLLNVAITNTYLHELGHAMDYDWNVSPRALLFKNNKYYEFLSSFPEIKKLVKKSYLKNRHKKLISKSDIDYYINPEKTRKPKLSQNYGQIKVDYETQSQMMKKYNAWLKEHSNNYLDPRYHSIKMDFSRAQKESFAESFSIISKLIINGYSSEHYYAKKHNNSQTRNMSQTLIGVMKWLVKNFVWENIGIPKHTLVKRKIECRRFIKSMEALPEISHYKMTKSRNIKNIKRLIKQRY